MSIKRVYDAGLKSVEMLEREIETALEEYCAKYDIDDLSKTPQNRWSGALMFCQKRCNIRENLLMPRGNVLDAEKVNRLCDIYIALCLMYDKEISTIGFTMLCGVHRETFYQWRDIYKKYMDEINDNINTIKASGEESDTKSVEYEDNYNRLNTKFIDICQKLNNYREESLSGKLSSGKVNPVGVLAILNHHFAWNLPGVSREAPRSVTALSGVRSEFASFADNKRPELSDNLAGDVVVNCQTI